MPLALPQLRVPALMPNPFAFELGRLVVGPSAMRLARALVTRCSLDVREGQGLGARRMAPGGQQQQQTEVGVGAASAAGLAGSSGGEASGWAMLDTARLHDALWARIEAVLTSGLGVAGAGEAGALVDPARDPWVGAAELTAMVLLQPALSTWAANERQRLLEHLGKAYGKPAAVLECTTTAVRAMYELYDSGALVGRAASPVWERAGLLRHADTITTMVITRKVQEREGRGSGGAPELRPVGVELTCWALRAAADQVDRCRAAGAPAAVKGLEKAWVGVAEGLSEVLVLANMIANPHGEGGRVHFRYQVANPHGARLGRLWGRDACPPTSRKPRVGCWAGCMPTTRSLTHAVEGPEGCGEQKERGAAVGVCRSTGHSREDGSAQARSSSQRSTAWGWF